MAATEFDADGIFAFFTQLGKEIDKYKDNIVVLREDGGKGFVKAAEGVEKFGQSLVKHHREGVMPMLTSIREMTTSLIGPVGLAYALYQVANSLETFAVGQIRQENFAKNTGFTVQSVKELTQAIRIGGMSFKEANQYIGHFGDLINDLRVNRQRSQIGQIVGALPRGGTEFAQELEGMAQRGESYRDIMVRYAQEVKKQEGRGEEGHRVALEMAKAVELPLSTLLDLEKNLQKVTHVKLRTPEERADQEKLNEEWVKTTDDFWNEMEEVGNTSAKLAIEAWKLWKNIYQPYKDAGTAEDWWTRQKSYYDFATDKGLDVDMRDPTTGLPMGSATGAAIKSNRGSYRNPKRQSEDDESALPKGAKPIMYTNVIENENQQKKLLGDIRDTLLLLDQGTGGAHGGEGGAPGGGGLTFRRGVRGGTGSSGGGNYSGGDAPTGKFTLGKSKRDTAGMVADELRKAGVPEGGIAGILANIREESNFDPTLRHFDQPRYARQHPEDPEGAYAHGLYQEGAEEWNNYAKWLKENHPGSDWRDPKLQTQFLVHRLSTAPQYKNTWAAILRGDKNAAAAAFAGGYLRPAAPYLASRLNKFQHGGVPDLSAYTDPTGARETVDKSLGPVNLRTGSQAKLNLEFKNVPKGVETDSSADGALKLTTKSSSAGLTPSQQLIAAKTPEEAKAAYDRSQTDWQK